MGRALAVGGSVGALRWERVGPAYSVWWDGAMLKPRASAAEVQAALAVVRAGGSRAAVVRVLYVA